MIFLNKRAVFFTTALLICSTSYLNSADIKKGKRERLRALGISFKVFEGFESRPISFPDILTNRTTKVKYYKEDDIWHYKQFAGKWSDDSSSIEVFEMLYPPPKNFNGYITELDTSKRYRNSSKSISWPKQKKLKWLEMFFGKMIDKEKPALINKYGTKIEYFPIADRRFFYGLFVISNSRYLNQCIVFLYKIQSSLSKKEVMKAIFSSIKSVKFYKKIADSSNKSKNDSSVKSSYEESKERVERSIRNLKDWWGLKSKDFFIITNYPKSSKTYIKKIRDELIEYQDIFKKYYKQFGPPKEMNVARIFNERDDYIAYVGKDKEFTAGLWMPSKKELVISSVPRGSDEYQKSEQIKTIRHEGFHQYLHYALDEVQTSVWFNEGNAVYFENVIKRGNTLKVEPSRYLSRVKELIKKPLNIDAMLKMEYEPFYAGGGTKDGTADNYAMAWAIVYFLHEGAPRVKRTRKHDYTKIIKKYYYYIRKTQSEDRATELAWKNINMKEFEKDFIDYYKNLK